MKTWEIVLVIYLFLGHKVILVYLLCKFKIGRQEIDGSEETNINISNETILNISNENNLCTICLDNIKENEYIYKLSCSHKYHIECLNRWVKEKPKCPLCLNGINLV